MAGGRKTELTQFCEKFPQWLHVVAQPDLPKDVPGMRSGHRGCAREGSPMARGGDQGPTAQDLFATMAGDSPHQVFCSLQDLGAWQALGECPRCRNDQ